MPITKIPVVHKFGIISSSQRVELHERLQKQAYLVGNKRKKPSLIQRDPLEVTEVFVQQFNVADSFAEKEKYEEKARKILERAKRRAGVKNCGYGDHVNLPLAWTELVQLAQCKGRLQEECLDILVTSLDISPLESYHIPALFFLAETMLYWLRTEEVLYPFLRTGEIKLLKMGQLIFERLFYHHMAGQLQEYMDSKKRLCTYVDGLEELQEVYEIFPCALLNLRFLTEVGRIILADCFLEQGDVNSDKLLEAPEQKSEALNLDTKYIYEYYNHEDIRSNHSRAISSSVHDLSPTLWHALDVFRCTNSLSGGLTDALKGLDRCGIGLASETWVDGIVAIQILGESAKTNMAALKVLHRLAQGIRTKEDFLATLSSSNRSGSSVPQGSLHNSEVFINDICEGGTGKEDRKQTTQTNKPSECVSIQRTYSAGQLPHAPGIKGWHWEVALTYTEVLENIVLYGCTAAIQKQALVGCIYDTEKHHHHKHNILNSASLLDLVFFNSRNKDIVGDLGPTDWSWRIRYRAMQSLVKICHSLRGDTAREGLRTAAWNTLLKANAKEKDRRVSEALRVEQLHVDITSFLDPSLQEYPVFLGNRIATGLSAAYLPPIPPPTTASSRLKFSPRPRPVVDVPIIIMPAEKKPLRTSLKQEIELTTALYEQSPDYNTRKSFDLRRIVEDQWRKELQAKLEDDEKEELRIVKEKQQNEEERQRQVVESKLKKIKKKSLA